MPYAVAPYSTGFTRGKFFGLPVIAKALSETNNRMLELKYEGGGPDQDKRLNGHLLRLYRSIAGIAVRQLSQDGRGL
jgi:hypothetical protein